MTNRTKFTLSFLATGTLVALSIVFFGQESPTPQPIPLFGVTADSLALDGIYAYPAEAEGKVKENEAKQLARGKQLRDEKVAEAMLIDLKVDDFDGTAWAILWDVKGKKASLPGDSQLPPEMQYVYTFSITFVDAETGRELTTLKEAQLLEPGKEIKPYKP